VCGRVLPRVKARPAEVDEDASAPLRPRGDREPMSESVREPVRHLERSAADVATLLLELERALRARRFDASAPGHCLGSSLERALRAWHLEVRRAGPIELELDDLGFHAAGVAERVAWEPLAGLAGALRATGAARLRVTEALDEAAMAGLLDILASAGSSAAGGSSLAENEPESRLREAQQRLAGCKGIELDRPSGDPLAPRATGEPHGSRAPAAEDRATRSGSDSPGAEPAPARDPNPPAAALGALVERALSPHPEEAVSAARQLLRHGDAAACALLERLESCRDRDRAAQLGAVVIALGERATQSLEQAIGSESPVRARIGVRLAGELQSPRLVPGLRAALLRGAPALGRDAARALATVANPEAVRALGDGLESPLEEVAVAAAGCLGALHRPESLGAMLRALDTAIARRRVTLSRELIRALTHFGPAGDGETSGDAADAPLSSEGGRAQIVPKLVSILERRNLLGRGALREPKLAALAALERMGGPEARRALRRATHARDAEIRERASRAMDRLVAAHRSAKLGAEAGGSDSG